VVDGAGWEPRRARLVERAIGVIEEDNYFVLEYVAEADPRLSEAGRAVVLRVIWPRPRGRYDSINIASP
jgi:hypothetical protein